MSAKFGARWPQMKEHAARFAEQFGLTGLKPPDVSPNTRKVLALAEYARDQGKLDAFRHVAMEAHWREGKNLGDDATLIALAKGVGLDEDGARAAMTSPELLARVDRSRELAESLGVSGIPTFFFGRYRVVGCQPYETLAEAADAAGFKRKAR